MKGADNVKRLSSQFIARFFGLFSDLAEQSIDAMLDLCEDTNVDIRKQVIFGFDCKVIEYYLLWKWLWMNQLNLLHAFHFEEKRIT